MIVSLIFLGFVYSVTANRKCSKCSLGFGIDDFPGEGRKTLRSKALKGFNFSSLLVPDMATCLECCADDCRCTSMNYKTSIENDGSHFCELNYETKVSKPGAISNASGFFYIDVYSYKRQSEAGQCDFSYCNNGCCKKSPCKNDGKCHELCDDIHRFNCTCTRIFEGRLCEKRKCNRTLSLVKDGYNETFCRPNIAVISCKEWLEYNFTISGVYPIDPDGNGEFDVWCDMDDGGHTVIQRNEINAAQSFVKNWQEYKVGFGNLSSMFWLGNEKIYRITNAQNTTLKVSVTYQNKVGVANYQMFYVENEGNGYRLHVSGYSGDAGDSFNVVTFSTWASNGQMFSTSDVDNDNCPDANCGTNGGWWHNYCSASILNEGEPQWFTFTGDNKKVQSSCMKVLGQK